MWQIGPNIKGFHVKSNKKNQKKASKMAGELLNASGKEVRKEGRGQAMRTRCVLHRLAASPYFSASLDSLQ